MSGLLDREKAPAAAARGDAEGQRAYNTFVKNGLRLIYDQRALPQVLRSLEGGGNPVLGLGNTFMMTMRRLEDSAAEHDVQAPPDVVPQGAIELLYALAELSKESGGHQFTDDELKESMQFAMQMHGAMKAKGGGQSSPSGAPAPRTAQPPRRGLAV